MEGAVDDVEADVRPGPGDLPAQPSHLLPPLLPELRAVLCAESGGGQTLQTLQTLHSGSF